MNDCLDVFLSRFAPEGIDLILDCMAGEDCERGLALLKFHGKYIMYGTSSLLSWDVKNFFGLTKGMNNVMNSKQNRSSVFSHLFIYLPLTSGGRMIKLVVYVCFKRANQFKDLI